MEKEKTQKEEVPCFCSQRWSLAYICFFGFIFVYALRVNLSVAIVCMVKSAETNSSDSYLENTTLLPPKCSDETGSDSIAYDHAEFDWSKNSRSTILASFFYGYIVTQVPGGWLADRFGGKRVFGIAMGIAGIATLLMPICARTSITLVYVIRILLGVATGVSFPAVQSIWGRWAPPMERSKLISVSYLGTMFGNVATFATAGVLCEYGFDNGWGSIFYITGGLTCIWVLCWFCLTSDTPQQHPRISRVERDHIVSSIEYNTSKRTVKVPWKEIAKSPAVWACLTAHVCNNWTNYTLLTSLPAFMKAVLKFDIKQNGVLSAVPYICQAVSGFLAGQTADIIRSNGWLSTTNTRRLYQVSSFIGAGVCSIATGFMSCEHRTYAVVFLSLAVMFTGFARGGYIVNHVDFAPKYAGVLYGITNTAATVPGMVAPIVAGLLTPNDTQEEWRNVFYVCAAFDIFGALVFGIFSRGELQPWAKDDMDIEMVVEENGKPPHIIAESIDLDIKKKIESDQVIEPDKTEMDKDADMTLETSQCKKSTDVNSKINDITECIATPDSVSKEAVTTSQTLENVSEEDVRTSQKPGNVIEEDITTSQKPENISDEDVTTSQKPENISDEDVTTSQKPENISDEDITASQKPENISDEDITASQKPENISDEDVTTSQKPENVSDGDVTTSQKPENVSDGDVTTSQKPENVSDENVTTSLTTEEDVSISQTQENGKSEEKITMDVESTTLKNDEKLEVVEINLTPKHQLDDITFVAEDITALDPSSSERKDDQVDDIDKNVHNSEDIAPSNPISSVNNNAEIVDGIVS